MRGTLVLKSRSAPLRIDHAKVARELPPLIVGAIQRRVQSGQDIEGKSFRAYSKSYQKTLAAMGEAGNADLRLTGGLMNSIRLLRVEKQSATRTVLHFGPGAGTSPQVRAPGEEERSYAREKNRMRSDKAYAKAGGPLRQKQAERLQSAMDKETARATRGRSIRTGKRSPPHNLLGLWLHKGTSRTPARPWLGLSPAQRKDVAARLVRMGIWRS
jgi:hypothetical protein